MLPCSPSPLLPLSPSPCLPSSLFPEETPLLPCLDRLM
ncbi:hypothetical protein CKA32_005344 [Geitlerinema sp. FC II]|nr:hypothetical protein CKA32_005344 [Geitlerinema sp. FC II]